MVRRGILDEGGIEFGAEQLEALVAFLFGLGLALGAEEAL